MNEKIKKQIIKDFGEPFNRKKDSIQVNQPCIAELFRQSGLYRYISPLRKFEKYDETTGLWSFLTEEAVKQELRSFAIKLGRSIVTIDVVSINTALKYNTIMDIMRSFRDSVAVDHLPPATSHCIHLRDCMLVYDLEKQDFFRQPFSPDFSSRNRIDLLYAPEAQCPRFINQLLYPMLDKKEFDDIFQQKFGEVLLKENMSQTILIISGAAGAGKSVLVNIVEGIVGLENVTELQPDRLNNAFEMIAYSQKNLLTAKDIENDALSANKVNALKKMTGNDLLACEQKHANERIFIRGNFNVFITGNGDLTINVGSGRDAFERRLLWINCVKPENMKRINNFDQILLKEEGAGILAWAIEGARKLLRNGGKIIKSKKQEECVRYLLNESDPVATFIQERVESSRNQCIPSSSIVPEFYKFAHDMGWNNASVLHLKPMQILQQFSQVMNSLHAEFRYDNNIKVPGKEKPCRGYMYCRFNKRTTVQNQDPSPDQNLEEK